VTSFAARVPGRGFESHSEVRNIYLSIITDMATGRRDFEVMSDKFKVG
jgi:hypothetical protein